MDSFLPIFDTNSDAWVKVREVEATSTRYRSTLTPLLSPLLRGKVAVVTGAARGIGRVAAVAFAHAGVDDVGIDIVFANADTQAFKLLLEMDDADWQIQIDNNLTGISNAIRPFTPYLVKRRGGRIIVTSSTRGRHWHVGHQGRQGI